MFEAKNDYKMQLKQYLGFNIVTSAIFINISNKD